MLIDWITLRHPLDAFGDALTERIRANLGRVVQVSPAGEVLWEKAQPDWDAIRSDSMGLFWSITGDNTGLLYLTLGASPSSLLHAGVNVFGDLSVESAARTVLGFAAKALGCILPDWQAWQCRRLDITANYDMGSAAQVKQALRCLLATDAPRRRTNSDTRGGDTVYWNPSSDLQAGKAYHKGAHLRMRVRKGDIVLDDDRLSQADNLLRLELKLGSRWFRRMAEKGGDWRRFSAEYLVQLHQEFFWKVIGLAKVEVSDMGKLLEELEKVAPTKGRALAAHRTWALIKTVGYSQTKDSMPRSTFFLHCGYLKDAGISAADLCAGKVLEFRRRGLVLSAPVLSWDEIKRAA